MRRAAMEGAGATRTGIVSGFVEAALEEDVPSGGAVRVAAMPEHRAQRRAEMAAAGRRVDPAALDRIALPPELEAALRDPESVPTVGQIASRPGARARGFRKAPWAFLAHEIVRAARGARAGRGFHVPPSRTHETLVAERHSRRLAVCRLLDGGGRVPGA